MSIAVVITLCFMLLIVGITSTAAAFCMRERNTANDRYKKLYDCWHNQIDEINDLRADLAYTESERDYWKLRYEDTVKLEPPQTTLTAPTEEGVA